MDKHTEKKAYVMLHNEELGRYLVASRDLEAGEEVLSEDAVVVGPKHHTPPLCLGCHAFTSGHVTCSQCGWPVCGDTCEQLSLHRDNECAVFAAAKVKFGPPPEDPSADCPQLECITPLRLLLTTGSDRWKNEVSLMETHERERQTSVDWHADQINIVKFLRDYCKLAHLYSEHLIQQICGILAVNTFEVHSYSTSGNNALRAVYPQTSLLAHNCVPNTTHSVNRKFQIRLRTTCPVAKGAPLYTTYTHKLSPTHTRRDHLLLSKYFECRCNRCSDPTELGSNLSTFKCPKCEWGWTLPAEPLHQTTDWRCQTCEHVMPNQAVVRVLHVLQMESSSLDADDIEAREALLRKYEGSLHPRHAHMLALQHSLSQLYGRVKGYTLDVMPDVLMERKIELCRHVLEVADILEPGKTRLRGTTLYELHAPLIMLARSQFQRGVLESRVLLERLKEAERALVEAVDILGLEDEASSEGQQASHGRVALQQLRDSLQQLDVQKSLSTSRIEETV